MRHALAQGNVMRAAAWLLLGIVSGLVLDLCAKQLLQSHSLIQFVVVRSSITVALMLFIAPRYGGLTALKSQEIGWHILRAVMAIGAMFGFFYGLANMPLVN